MLKSPGSIFTFFALLLATSSYSQIQMSFDEFRNWIQTKAPAGYSVSDFNDEESSYSAMLVKGSRLVTVSLNDVGQLDDDLRPLKSNGKPVEYEHNGNRCVFSSGEIKVLYVQILSINGTLILGTTDLKVTRADLEYLADELGIGSLKPVITEANSWPAEIPAELRLDAELMSVEKMEASTEGYLYEYHVRIKNNDQLIPAIRKVTSACGGDISMVNHKNFTLICGDTDSIEGLQSMRTDQSILFIYYKSDH